MTAPISWTSTPIARCELEGELVKGIHRARRDGRAVAVKVLEPGAMPPGIETALRLSGPWVAEVLDVGRLGERAAVVSEWVEGVTLAQLCSGHDGFKLPQSAALYVGFQVARALTAAHELEERALVHGALDPTHVLCGADGSVKVCSFGGPAVRAARLRAHRGFVAPEVLAGETPDVLSDVYGVGALAYWLLTGRTPGEAQLADGGSLAAPSAHHPTLDAGIDAALLQLLAEDPCDRAHSARVLTAAIDAWLEELDLELDSEPLATLVARRSAPV